MSEPSAKSVVIVGAGIAGLSTAWYALQKGMRVTVLERSGPDHQGCSLGNAGMLVPSHIVPLAAPGMVGTGLRMLANPESPFSIRPRLSSDLIDWAWRFWRSSTTAHVQRSMPLLRDLHLMSGHCYNRFVRDWGNLFRIEKHGLLMLCETEHALKEESELAGTARSLGLAAEELTHAEISRLEPGIRMNVVGGVYFPQDACLHPGKLMQTLASQVVHTGGEIRYETQVTGWDASADAVRAVRTNTGQIAADEFVVAGGAWSPELLRPLGIRLPMQAGKGYSITLEQPRELPRICAILNEARVAVTPMGGALRFAGTMEIVGNDLSINEARVRGIVKLVCRAFPSFTPEDFRDAPVWSGLRPCSPDGLPYVGRFRRYSNLSACTGHAMMGISLGPISGRIVAELLAGERPSIESPLIAPDRFA